MDEHEYRDTYHSLNEIGCVFEKTLTARQGGCSQSRHFFLAGREGYGCQDAGCQRRCQALLTLLRQRARFALGITQANGPLPHNKEIRVQVGGLRGLYELVYLQQSAQIPDIVQLVDVLSERYPDLEQLPFSRLLPAMTAFTGRQRRQRK